MKITEILTQCFALGDALETISYAMEFVNYNMDIDEQEFQKIVGNIYGAIKCLADYQRKITDDIESLKGELKEADSETEEIERKYREERLIWVYRHMDANDKGRLDRYCDGFKLGYDFRGEVENSVVKGQGEADTP